MTWKISLEKRQLPVADKKVHSLKMDSASSIRHIVINLNVILSYCNTLFTCEQILQQVSGFIDIDKIDPDACPALVADLSAGEQGIIALSFGLLYSSVTASSLDFTCIS